MAHDRRTAGSTIMKTFIAIIGSAAMLGLLMPKAGAATEAEAIAWANEVLGRSDRGVFFGACNFYSYIGRRRP